MISATEPLSLESCGLRPRERKATTGIYWNRSVALVDQRSTAVKSPFLSRRLASKYVRDNYGLRCSEKWLAKLVVTGGGPDYWKDGRSVLYSRDELDAWVKSRIRRPWVSPSNRSRSNLRRNDIEGLPYVDV